MSNSLPSGCVNLFFLKIKTRSYKSLLERCTDGSTNRLLKHLLRRRKYTKNVERSHCNLPYLEGLHRYYSFNRRHIVKFYFRHSCVVPRVRSSSLCLFSADTSSHTLMVNPRSPSDAY